MFQISNYCIVFHSDPVNGYFNISTEHLPGTVHWTGAIAAALSNKDSSDWSNDIDERIEAAKQFLDEEINAEFLSPREIDFNTSEEEEAAWVKWNNAFGNVEWSNYSDWIGWEDWFTITGACEEIHAYAPLSNCEMTEEAAKLIAPKMKELFNEDCFGFSIKEEEEI